MSSHCGIFRRPALMADVVVLAVDYRRAPENSSAAAVDDAVSAYTWALEQLSELGGSAQNGVALADNSAGGAIALLAATKLVEDSMSPSRYSSDTQSLI
ncbi:alpha/beta hydrolase [Paeniglutamicibacter sp. ANT13_2]|uniref:Alpha/beta hydrolase n=1 Tax=Paeniglutamicibacter terrestris TaxID=2723403 RepID=A0ABX1FZZ2_9MICC|nr:alpha/beta hydrolase [Paeniglutamicibacter terrestris]